MRITCVHQGYELYGSDRAFAESVTAFRRAYPEAAIDVVLPRDGGIADLLRGVATRIVFEPIWVLRRRTLWRLVTVGMSCLPWAIARAVRRFRGSDLVYINTSVVTDYMLAARLFPGRALLHIHEIPEGATLRLLRGLVRWSGAEIIFNSKATRDAFALPAATRAHVVYNGVPAPAAPESATYDGTRALRVLMMGRINRIKGQEVLIEALRLMRDCGDRIEVRMVGSAFENPSAEQALRGEVGGAGLDAVVTLLPFTTEPEVQMRWADVVVVPSRRPESLGMVAIEAMAFGRPPIVSGIGGLREVVEHGESGWIVPPNEPAAIAAALRDILSRPEELRRRAQPARRRYDALFGTEAAAAAMAAVLAAMLETSAGPGQPARYGTARPDYAG